MTEDNGDHLCVGVYPFLPGSHLWRQNSGTDGDYDKHGLAHARSVMIEVPCLWKRHKQRALLMEALNSRDPNYFARYVYVI